MQQPITSPPDPIRDRPMGPLRAAAPFETGGEDLSLEPGLMLLTYAFAEGVGAETALLVVCEERDDVAWTRASWGLSEDAVPIRSGEGAAGRLLRAGEAAVVELGPQDGDPIAAATGGAPVTTAVGAPVRSPAGAAGALCAGLSRSPRDERGLLLKIAEAYAAVAALCLDGSWLLGGLMEATRRDQLTGCLNHAALQRAIGREISRSERHGRNLACCFIDLDGFKRVNDTRGHQSGNRAIAAVASALRGRVRDADLVGRFGGDEFVVLLPETGKRVALGLGRRLRAEIERATTAAIGEPIGASIGVAEWTPGCSTEALLERADHGLRIAKAAGGAVIAAPVELETPRLDTHQASRPPRRAKRSPDGPTTAFRSEDLQAVRGRIPTERGRIPMVVDADLPRAPSAAAQARTLVADFGSGLDPAQRGDAILAVSELVANAYRHGKGRINLRLTSLAHGLRAEVADEGEGFDPGADAGLGLTVVAGVSDAWGLNGSGSNQVWFEISASDNYA